MSPDVESPEARATRAWELRHKDPRAALVLAENLQRENLDALTRAQAELVIGTASYRLSDNERALAATRVALAEFNQLGALPAAQRGAAEAWNTLGNIQHALGRLFEALEAHHTSLQLRETLSDRAGRAASLNNLGIVHERLGNYPQALEALYQSLRLKQELGDRAGQAYALNNLGNVHQALGDHAAAIASFEESYQLSQAHGNRYGEAYALNGLGTAHFARGDAAAARTAHERSLQLKREMGDRYGEAWSLAALAPVQRQLGEREAARLSHERGLALRNEIGDRPGQAASLRGLAAHCLAEGEYAEARQHLDRALLLAEALAAKTDQYEAHRLLGECCERQGDLSAALQHQRKFHELKEEVFNERSAAAVRTLALLHEAESARRESELFRLRNRELETALEAERELNTLKTEFINLVSHEYRTPLAIILTSAEILEVHFARLPEDERAAHLRHIRDGTQQLSRLVDQVLFLGKSDVKKLVPVAEPLALVDLCARVCDEIASATGRRGQIRFESRIEPTRVQSDENLLRHIMGNLLGNAVKYSPVTEPVDFVLERSGASAVLTIIDRGIGIPAADQARVFQWFFRGRNAGTTRGTGLGLVIVKRAVDLLGGTLELRSEETAGTTVRVELPLFEGSG